MHKRRRKMTSSEALLRRANYPSVEEGSSGATHWACCQRTQRFSNRLWEMSPGRLVCSPLGGPPAPPRRPGLEQVDPAPRSCLR
jgi:hypothetical protein